MLKKIIALLISSVFAFSLGIAFAEEENVLNPWGRDMPRSTKKDDKAKKQMKKTDKKKDKSGGVDRAKRTNSKKVEHASVAKTEKKDTGQNKGFLFW